LDGQGVTNEGMGLASSIYMKKKMYYNMRTKTLKRNATNVVNRATQIFSQRVSSVNVTLNMLRRKRGDVEGGLEGEYWRRVVEGFAVDEEGGLQGTTAGQDGDQEDDGEQEEDEEDDSVATVTTDSATSPRSPTSYGTSSMTPTHKTLSPVIGGPHTPPRSPRAAPMALSPTTESALLKKQRALTKAIEVLGNHVERMEGVLEKMKRGVGGTCGSTIKRLMLEFHTGGNIRVEEGSPADVWYNSCIDLVSSRFDARDPGMVAKGIKGVRVNRITRIHNRFLRHRFENGVREVLETSGMNSGEEEGTSASGSKAGTSGAHQGGTNGGQGGHPKVPKKMLEYVFYGVNPLLRERTGNTDEIVRVAEDGFRTPAEYARFGFLESIKLHSTVDGADLERVKTLQSGDGDSDAFEMSGQILLVKTFVGDRKEIADEDEVRMFKGDVNTHSAFQKARPEEDEAKEGGDGDADKAASSSSKMSHKGKTWHIFNPALALPEYLIDFEYLTEDNCQYDPKERNEMLDDLKKSLVRASGGVKDPSDQVSGAKRPALPSLPRHTKPTNPIRPPGVRGHGPLPIPPELVRGHHGAVLRQVLADSGRALQHRA